MGDRRLRPGGQRRRRKLPTPELKRIIDALIAETDLRAGDTDREPDSDDEPDDAA